jgi:hypothetical protein
MSTIRSPDAASPGSSWHMRESVVCHRSFACWCRACLHSKGGRGLDGGKSLNGSVRFAVHQCASSSQESRLSSCRHGSSWSFRTLSQLPLSLGEGRCRSGHWQVRSPAGQVTGRSESGAPDLTWVHRHPPPSPDARACPDPQRTERRLSFTRLRAARCSRHRDRQLTPGPFRCDIHTVTGMGLQLTPGTPESTSKTDGNTANLTLRGPPGQPRPCRGTDPRWPRVALSVSVE